MITSKNDNYILLFSSDPCDLFRYFQTENLHGLNLTDCEEYNNTPDDSYIAGMCNIDPYTGEKYIFINLSRCTDDIHTMGLIMHEAMHLSFSLFSDEEEMITFAENEAYKIIDKINHEIKITQNKQQ